MNMNKKYTTFTNDKKRRILCPACGHYIGSDTHLGEKKERILKCCRCGSFMKLAPPRKFEGEVDGKEGKWIVFGPNEGMFTADLTENEYDDTIPIE